MDYHDGPVIVHFIGKPEISFQVIELTFYPGDPFDDLGCRSFIFFGKGQFVKYFDIFQIRSRAVEGRYLFL
jgi:hypothetical protein